MAEPAGKSDEVVLGEVLVNGNVLSTGVPGDGPEDEDYALAKVLQEQERAFLMLAGGGEGSTGLGENHRPSGGQGGSGGGDGAGPHDGGGGEEGEEPTDEELARRWQAEEDLEFHRRMLAMAGVGPGAGGEGEGEEGEGGYYSEDDADPDNMSYEELTALGEAVGTVSRGLSAAQVAALPVRRYAECTTDAGGGGGGGSTSPGGTADEQCSVCRMEFEGEDEVRQLPRCRHYFHSPCIEEWLRRNKACCICNVEVYEEQAAAAAAGAPTAGAAAPLGSRQQN